MAEDENIYYIQKQEDGTHLSCVWQDAYTEVVAFEENVQDNSNLNITYVTEDNESSNENYETAGEDSQYYSVIETNDTLDHEQTLQPLTSQMDLNEDFKDNLTVIQYPAEDMCVKDELIDPKVENCDNTIVEDDDQVILYKIEDSNELFAVQIARDSDGNIQKYQYKVRQNEDGQLEAVPGTIQIQPEGTDQLISEDVIKNEEMTINQNIVEDETQNFQSIYENSLTDGIKSENVVEEITNENENITGEIQTEETIYEDATNEIEVAQEYPTEDEVVEKLDDENNHIEYLKQDEAEVLQHTGGETYFEEEEEEFENVEYLQEDDEEEVHYEELEDNFMEEPPEHILSDLSPEEDQTFVKQYPPSSQVEVLSNVLMESNINDTLTQEEPTPPAPPTTVSSNTPKQILNKLSNITFGNESIELKRINSGATSKQANKLTFLIVTHPETEKQNKNLINNKKFRSILRPTIHQHNSLQKTAYPPVFKANCKQIKQKTEVPISKVNNTVLSVTPSLNKGPRQPRKQVITPVDRVGSEIIIQAPEEKEIPVETYDLDAFSDEEYSPKVKPKKIYSTKKRGKKSTKLVEAVVISDNNSKSTFEDDVEIKNEIEERKIEKPVEIKKPEKPKFDKILPTRKRGRPGRPKLSEKNKLNMIEKEVISSGSMKGGQSGRPKFIRTTRKISNGKQKNDSKENEEKSIPIEKESNEEVVNDERGLTTPKRRGRPPKKYSPDDNVTRKRKSSSDDVKKKNISDKYFGFCSDSELEDKETIHEEPDIKKQKTDIENEKIDDLMSEMQDIHGVSDEEEQPAKIDDMLDEKPTETETLLSILETSPNEKEDVLTRALKSANIITPEEVKQEENSFLETTDKKSVNSEVNELKKISVENKPAKSTATIYKCAKCSKTFLKYMSLKTHLQEHTEQNKKGKFNCSKCPRVFTFENALKFHEKTHQNHHSNQNLNENLNNTKNFHCTHCKKPFKTMLQLKSHQLQHKQYQCEKCSENFQNRSELINHLRSHTKKENEDISNKSTKSRIFRRSTQDKREFSEILSKIDTTKRKTIATAPLSSGKTSNDVKIPAIDVHRCNVCMKTFRQLAHLVMHREVHQKPTCSNCGQIFPFKHVLSEHMRRYCLKSPRITNTLGNTTIKKRQSLQKDNTTFDCEKCKKSFKNKMFYQNHMKIHLKKSPNKQRNSVFIRKSVMDKSKILNTTLSAATISERRKSDRKQVPTQKVMPIRCEICDLSFTTYTGLYRHTLSHPDIKEKCEYCDAGFETKAQLLKHLQTHVKSDIKIECHTCKKIFKTNDELIKHKNECSEGNDTLDKLNSEQSGSSSLEDKTLTNDSNKNVLLTMRKSVNISKKLAHGGIPLPLKLQNKLLKRKL